MDVLFEKAINFLDAEFPACASGKLCSTMGRLGCSQVETVGVLGSAENLEGANLRFLRGSYKLLEQRYAVREKTTN
jgi:hypothetical protein